MIRNCVAVLCLLTMSASLLAQDSVQSVELVPELPTLHCLGYRWFISGDGNQNATVQVAFRQVGTEEWRNAMPLRRVEVAYGTARLGLEARKRRETLQADPKVRAAEKARQEERREQASRESLVRAQRLVVNREYHQAKEQCRAIIRTYPGTPAATRAQTLLDQLRRAGK